jgi:hypothetical protein
MEKYEAWDVTVHVPSVVQGGLNMTGTDHILFTHKQSRSYLNPLVTMEQLQHCMP